MSLKRVRQLVDFMWPKMPNKPEDVPNFVQQFRKEFDRYRTGVSKTATDLKYFGFPAMTTAERNALDANELQTGQAIFNTNLTKVQFWDGAAWQTVTSV